MNTCGIFSVANHHPDGCGQPPWIDDAAPTRYLGYFENQHREQAIFVYDRVTGKGTLHMGDAAGRRIDRSVDRI